MTAPPMRATIEIRTDREPECEHSRYRWYCYRCAQDGYWQNGEALALWLAAEHSRYCSVAAGVWS